MIEQKILISPVGFFRFDMPAPRITPEIKKDLEILKVGFFLAIFLAYLNWKTDKFFFVLGS